MPAAHPRTAPSGVPSPMSAGSTALRILSICCSITQLLASFTTTLASAIGLSVRGQGCCIICSGSGFCDPPSRGAVVAAVQSFTVLRGSAALGSCPDPQHPQIARQLPCHLGLTQLPAQPLAMRLTNLEKVDAGISVRPFLERHIAPRPASAHRRQHQLPPTS